MFVVAVMQQVLCYQLNCAALVRHLFSLQTTMIINFKLSTWVKFLISISEQPQKLTVYLIMWDGPSVLLSLRLRNHYAQTIKLFSVCVCWHLNSIGSDGDEVKGLCSLVYEDNSSETYQRALFVVGLLDKFLSMETFLFPLWLCIQIYDNSSQFSKMQNSQWASSLGYLLFMLMVYSCCLLIGTLLVSMGSPAKQMQDFARATGTTEYKLTRVYIAVFWNFKLSCWYLLLAVMTKRSSDSMYLLIHVCNSYVEWSGILYMCVSVLCLKALAQHHWMLCPAQRGLKLITGIQLLANIQQIVFFRQAINLPYAADTVHFRF